jgi:hypothetical protein
MQQSDLPEIIGAIGGLGIIGYQLSQGQSVAVTSVGGVPVVSSGPAAYGNLLLPLALILLAGIALFVFVK